MKSLKEVVCEAVKRKADIVTDEDQIRYDIRRLRSKLRKLSKAGKSDEAMAIEAQLTELRAKLGKNATKSDKEESFEIDTREVPEFQLYWHRTSFFTRPSSNHTSAKGILRELWDEYWEEIDKRIGLKKFKDNGLTRYKWGNKIAYFPDDSEAFAKMMTEWGTSKVPGGDFVTYYAEKVGTKTIEVVKDDTTFWRYPGEKDWRRFHIIETL